MLHSLNGILLDCEDDYAVVDCHGVRFQCEVPGSTAKQLPAAGSPVTLRTRLSFNTNDGAFTLFGFATPMEADCFDVLTSMSGIGPRKALGILSQIEVSAFATAIVGRDMAYVSKIKGVGQKTAERLIVELREKMIPFAGATTSTPSAISRPENIADAIEALVALGVKPITAEAAVDRAAGVLGMEARTEDLVREGLRHR